MYTLSHAVRDARWDKARALMDELRIDAFVFTSADFFQFATNFHTDVQVWERPIYAVLPREGRPFLIMNELSTHHVRYSIEGGKLWIDDISFWAEHPRVASRLPLAPQLPELIAERLHAAGLARSRIAVEGGIDAAAAAVIERAGFGHLVRHRAGHAIGVQHHEYPEDMAFNHRPLRDNEVYSAEPGLYAWGVGGFRLDDTVVVGTTPRVLTHTPKTLAYATVA